MPNEIAAPYAFPDGDRPGGSSRALGWFIAASLAVHAGFVAILPVTARDAMPTWSTALEVVLATPQPALAPVIEAVPAPSAPSPVEPVQASRPRPAPVSVRAARATPEPVFEGSFSVSPSRLPDAAPPPASAPAPAAAPEVLAVTPPVFSARYLGNAEPPYPEESRRTGEEGTVLLRVLVKRDGLPLRVELDKSSGSSRLDVAARDAVWAWRFDPARQGTDPVESWIGVPVVFRLDRAN